MPIIRHLDQLPAAARGGAVAIGNFDGVHLGHRRIVEQLRQRAEEVGGQAIVFTFDPHPVRLLRPEQCPPPLTWTTRKAELLAGLGVFKIVAYPTDEALLELTAAEFFQRIVVDALDAKAMVEGPNFYFGKNREGTIEKLRALTSQAGMSLDVVEPVAIEGPDSETPLVSSSRIRTAIAQGEVAFAAKLLGEPYRLRGMVAHGAGRGAKIGFPTANLEAIDTLLPAQGVYAGRALVDINGGPQWYAAAIHLGPNPTFGEEHTKVEIHLLGKEVALYGKPMEVEFVERIRGIEKFESKEELVEQLERDIEQVRATFE